MHDDEKKKETLTKENIKKDILPLLLLDIPKNILFYGCLLLLALMFDWRLASHHISFRVTFVVFIISMVIIIPTFIQIFILTYKTCKFKFVINRDFLVDKQEGGPRVGILRAGTPILGGLATVSHEPYKLQFGRYGTFTILGKRHYKWSSLYTMNDEELFHSSQLKDDFLLISLNGKHIDMAYNLRLFDFKE